jgi:predicted nucleic acid-binding protein
MQVLISDASVLIDIEQSGLTSAMFTLPYQFAVPDILFVEELAERHARLSQFGLVIKPMNSELITEAYLLHQKYPKPSVNDLLALVLAKHENSQLLTGDKDLREVAKKFDVEVHGTIWLVQQLIQYGKITAEDANSAFQHMKDSGSRLPWGEVQKILMKMQVIEVVNESN